MKWSAAISRIIWGSKGQRDEPLRQGTIQRSMYRLPPNRTPHFTSTRFPLVVITSSEPSSFVSTAARSVAVALVTTRI